MSYFLFFTPCDQSSRPVMADFYLFYPAAGVVSTLKIAGVLHLHAMSDGGGLHSLVIGAGRGGP